MWITLPLAAVTAFVLATRGRPWLGAVAATLGFYLVQAAWALLAEGTGGFADTVSSPGWWQPAAVFGLAALGTGVPAVRRRLLGRGAWKRALVEHSQVSPSPIWQTKLIDMGIMGHIDCVESAMEDLIPGERPFGNDLRRHVASSQEHRVSGPLGQARAALDSCLDALPASGEATQTWSQGVWKGLLAVDPQTDTYSQPESGTDHKSEANALSVSDRSELVVRAASHSTEAGLALSWCWFSGLRDVIEELGTEGQKEAWIPHLSANGQALAAGWSGTAQEPGIGVVTHEQRGKDKVLGLRISYDINAVVGAGAASALVLMVEVTDPDGLLASSEAVPEGFTPTVGTTCVIVRPSNGLSLLEGASVTERLASHPLAGSVRGEERFIGPDDILGGLSGIGSAGTIAKTSVASWEAVRTTSVLAGVGQRFASERGSDAILRNVMNGETIEAWGHAELGASALRLNGLAKVAARIVQSRPLQPSESYALATAARRCAAGLQPEAGPGEQAQDRPATGLERLLEALPAPPTPETHLRGWLPSWYIAGADAAASNSAPSYDRARSKSLRELVTAAATAVSSQLSGLRADRSGEAHGDHLEAACAAITKAYATVRCCALRDGTASEVVSQHLAFAEERITSCAFLALADRAQGSQPVEQGLFRFAALSELAGAYTELAAAIGGLPGRFHRSVSQWVLRDAKVTSYGPAPAHAEAVAAAFVANPDVLRRLTNEAYHGHAENGGSGPLRQASRLAAASRVPIAAVQRAQALGQLPGDEFHGVLDLAVERRIVSVPDVAKIRACMAVASEFLSGSDVTNSEIEVRQTA